MRAAALTFCLGLIVGWLGFPLMHPPHSFVGWSRSYDEQVKAVSTGNPFWLDRDNFCKYYSRLCVPGSPLDLILKAADKNRWQHIRVYPPGPNQDWQVSYVAVKARFLVISFSSDWGEGGTYRGDTLMEVAVKMAQ